MSTDGISRSHDVIHSKRCGFTAALPDPYLATVHTEEETDAYSMTESMISAN